MQRRVETQLQYIARRISFFLQQVFYYLLFSSCCLCVMSGAAPPIHRSMDCCFFARFVHYLPLSTCCRRVGLERSPINTSVKGFTFFCKICLPPSLRHLLPSCRVGTHVCQHLDQLCVFCNILHCLPFNTCCLPVRRSSFTTPRFFISLHCFRNTFPSTLGAFM